MATISGCFQKKILIILKFCPFSKVNFLFPPSENILLNMFHFHCPRICSFSLLIPPYTYNHTKITSCLVLNRTIWVSGDFSAFSSTISFLYHSELFLEREFSIGKSWSFIFPFCESLCWVFRVYMDEVNSSLKTQDLASSKMVAESSINTRMSNFFDGLEKIFNFLFCLVTFVIEIKYIFY